MPSSQANASPAAPERRLTAARSTNNSLTGRPNESDMPKSPRASRARYLT